MEIIFLGTSSGTPTKHRNVAGVVVKKRHEKAWCLVDCGEGTQHQILHTKLSLNNLSAIMITHVHGDHCFGLPGLLASAAMAGRTAPLTIIAPTGVKTLIETAQKVTDTYLAFAINYMDVASLNPLYETDDFLISKHHLSHRVPSFAYGFVERHVERTLDVSKLQDHDVPAGPIWGQIQNGEDVKLASGEVLHNDDYILPSRKPRKVIVGGDNDSPELLADAVKDTDVLIHESTYTADVSEAVGPGPQHSSAKQVAKFAEKSGLRNLILMHFSARYAYGQNQKTSIDEIKDEAIEYYSGQLYLANDFDVFYLNKEGQVELIDSRELT